MVSSYKITPPIHFDILLEFKRVSLNNSLFSGVEETFTESNLLVIVPVLSSAAKIPFPPDSILRAISLRSDIINLEHLYQEVFYLQGILRKLHQQLKQN